MDGATSSQPVASASDIERENESQQDRAADKTGYQADNRVTKYGRRPRQNLLFRHGLGWDCPIRPCFRHGDIGNETVAAARYGFDKARAIGGISQRVAQPGYGAVEALIELDESVRRPDVFAQLFAADDLSAIFQQKAQDLERLVLQLDPGTLLAQFTAVQVEFKHPEPHEFRAGVLRRHR